MPSSSRTAKRARDGYVEQITDAPRSNIFFPAKSGVDRDGMYLAEGPDFHFTISDQGVPAVCHSDPARHDTLDNPRAVQHMLRLLARRKALYADKAGPHYRSLSRIITEEALFQRHPMTDDTHSEATSSQQSNPAPQPAGGEENPAPALVEVPVLPAQALASDASAVAGHAPAVQAAVASDDAALAIPVPAAQVLPAPDAPALVAPAPAAPVPAVSAPAAPAPAPERVAAENPTVLDFRAVPSGPPAPPPAAPPEVPRSMIPGRVATHPPASEPAELSRKAAFERAGRCPTGDTEMTYGCQLGDAYFPRRRPPGGFSLARPDGETCTGAESVSYMTSGSPLFGCPRLTGPVGRAETDRIRYLGRGLEMQKAGQLIVQAWGRLLTLTLASRQAYQSGYLVALLVIVDERISPDVVREVEDSVEKGHQLFPGFYSMTARGMYHLRGSEAARKDLFVAAHEILCDLAMKAARFRDHDDSYFQDLQEPVWRFETFMDYYFWNPYVRVPLGKMGNRAHTPINAIFGEFISGPLAQIYQEANKAKATGESVNYPMVGKLPMYDPAALTAHVPTACPGVMTRTVIFPLLHGQQLFPAHKKEVNATNRRPGAEVEERCKTHGVDFDKLEWYRKRQRWGWPSEYYSAHREACQKVFPPPKNKSDKTGSNQSSAGGSKGNK